MMFRRCAAAAGVALLAATLSGCADEDSIAERPISATGPAVDGSPLGVATVQRWTGPQGRTGQFVAKCTYSHTAMDDPIVHFGHPGRSHSHEFYGAADTDANSRSADLVDGATTCDKPADRAAYWHPTVYNHGERVEATTLAAYYRAAPGVNPKDVQPFPFGLAMLAGDQTATTPQPGEATGWTCGSRTTLSDEIPNCASTAPLHFVLTFPDCWDGRHLDSADHNSHVAYSADGACPDGYPVHIPQLTNSYGFSLYGPDLDITLASGSVYSLHGDFLDGWVPSGLAREVDNCVRRGVVCDLVSNRAEESLFSG